MAIIARDGAFSAQKLVICEGFGDVRFVDALLNQRGIHDIEVGCPNQQTNGADGYTAIPNYLRAIRSHRNARTLQSICVVIDGDDVPGDRVKFASGAFASADLISPTEDWTHGTGAIRTAVVTVPGKGRQGTLEHMLVAAIFDSHRDLARCITDLTACADRPSRYSPNKLAKMQFVASVAAYCEDDPSVSLSYLWSKRAEHNPVNLASQTFDELAGFLSTI